jgi:hypothetical protein
VVPRHGALEDATDTDRLRSACLRGDHDQVKQQLAADPALLQDPAEVLGDAIAHAAETGNTAAVTLMLDLGYPLDAHDGEDGGTVLHTAAYAGSADTVGLLLGRGADVEARDTRWDSTPLIWATIGSGQRPRHNPGADWLGTVRALIEAGASSEGITLSPDDPQPPSHQVAELLRSYGIGTDTDLPNENAGSIDA